jgi:hypothetical protein
MNEDDAKKLWDLTEAVVENRASVVRMQELIDELKKRLEHMQHASPRTGPFLQDSNPALHSPNASPK